MEDAQQLSSLFLKLRPSGPTSLRQGVHTCCLLFEPEEGEEGKFSSKAGRVHQGTIWSRAFPAGTRSEDQPIVLLLTVSLGSHFLSRQFACFQEAAVPSTPPTVLAHSRLRAPSHPLRPVKGRKTEERALLSAADLVI